MFPNFSVDINTKKDNKNDEQTKTILKIISFLNNFLIESLFCEKRIKIIGKNIIEDDVSKALKASVVFSVYDKLIVYAKNKSVFINKKSFGLLFFFVKILTANIKKTKTTKPFILKGNIGKAPNKINEREYIVFNGVMFILFLSLIGLSKKPAYSTRKKKLELKRRTNILEINSRTMFCHLLFHSII